MKFIDKKYQKNPIRTMHEEALKSCDEIWAAVAYVDNTQIHQNLFIDSCHKNNIPLKLYARYDYSIPVGLDILKWFLDKKSPNYSCRLVPNRLHSKIIWYRPYGIYVGSANLTSRAWIKNLEAGFFLTQVELEREKMLDDIKDYFDLIHEYSYDLTTEIYDKLLEYKDANSKELNKLQKKFADIPGLPPKDFIDAHQSRRESHQRKKEEFLKEWNNTLQDIRNIAERVAKDYQPDWINDDVPPGVLADQFLHAYYDNCKKEYKIPKVYYKLHEENNNDVESHLVSAMEWWKKLPEAVFGVDRHIYDCAPKLRDYFSKKRILTLSEEDFIDAMTMIHSFSDYARRTSIYEKGKYNKPERVNMLAKEVYEGRNDSGQTILELFYYVLYEGTEDKIPERIYNAYNEKKIKFPYVGLSTIGEVVGWALPDKFPPRNGRTSKALYALGYDVELYTE